MTTTVAEWDVETTKIFIDLCVDQIYKKQRLGSSFTRDGWKQIVPKFNETTGKGYTKKQLKNRLDSLKAQWTAWEKLFSKETGIAIDYVKNVVVADDEWWERKIKENKAYGKYRYKGLNFAKELRIIFKDVLASGEEMNCPSATRPVSLGDDEEVYRPQMDLQEGSGDSEEELQGTNNDGSLQVPVDLECMNLTSNTQPSGSASIGKRKRSEGTNGKNKKKKTLVDAVSVIADASKDSTIVLKKLNERDDRTSAIVAELLTIPEIVSDSDFRRRCCNMMMHRTPQNMFLGLKGEKSALMDWLREHAYSRPNFLTVTIKKKN
ncbi:hypothetical protein QN277_018468 [Acacia crassicarpa]|uniref:Myb/SANT-like domain-containing protein n=1 Tax=Acacia crassicarpa TaxID=499986 RepID=A0AAE1JRM7_9FABA|nr:hypothetical protein QN277_018468 [Acacia crassicarpa]